MGVDKKLLKGLNSEQQSVVKYFLADGCLGRIGCMSDEDYDKLVVSKVKSLNLKKRALGKIGLDEDQVSEIAPINFEGFDFKKAYARRGKDNKWRSSKYQSTWLFFSDDQVYVYVYEINTDCDEKKERTEEYFYRDVTNFSTATETEETKMLDKNGRRQTVEYATFSVVVPGDKITCSISNTRGDVDRSISAMKQKLREKKSQSR